MNNTRSSATESPELHLVWLDESAKIASFHHVEGYRKLRFMNHESFMDFLRSLQQKNYSFQ